eukprot:8440724-Alexandrium_andersonii.AAC.1
MSASLVGSEMCIRDRISKHGEDNAVAEMVQASQVMPELLDTVRKKLRACLLYTSDAADDM